MFSNLLRQQARLAFSTRLTVPLRQQSQKSVLALSTQKSQILSQRTFSISRSLFEEAPVAPVVEKPAADATSRSRTANTRVAEDVEARGQHILYVGNLPFSVEEGEIRTLFEPYGQVEHVRLSK
jgi:RNA recognition motif-containing protein